MIVINKPILKKILVYAKSFEAKSIAMRAKKEEQSAFVLMSNESLAIEVPILLAEPALEDYTICFAPVISTTISKLTDPITIMGDDCSLTANDLELSAIDSCIDNWNSEAEYVGKISSESFYQLFNMPKSSPFPLCFNIDKGKTISLLKINSDIGCVNKAKFEGDSTPTTYSSKFNVSTDSEKRVVDFIKKTGPLSDANIYIQDSYLIFGFSTSRLIIPIIKGASPSLKNLNVSTAAKINLSSLSDLANTKKSILITNNNNNISFVSSDGTAERHIPCTNLSEEKFSVSISSAMLAQAIAILGNNTITLATSNGLVVMSASSGNCSSVVMIGGQQNNT